MQNSYNKNPNSYYSTESQIEASSSVANVLLFCELKYEKRIISRWNVLFFMLLGLSVMLKYKEK